MVIVNFPGHIDMPPDITEEDERIRMLVNKNRDIRNKIFILITTHPPDIIS